MTNATTIVSRDIPSPLSVDNGQIIIYESVAAVRMLIAVIGDFAEQQWAALIVQFSEL